jgi:hypothetical protein
MGELMASTGKTVKKPRVLRVGTTGRGGLLTRLKPVCSPCSAASTALFYGISPG